MVFTKKKKQVTFECLVDLVPELIEPAPLGLPLGDLVLLNPASASKLVEVLK